MQTERLALVKLSEGHGWLDNISEELNAEYDRKFDTVDGRQSAFAAAVHKDITRTFGIFGAELRAMGSRRPGPGVFEAQLERLLLATTHECEYCQGEAAGTPTTEQSTAHEVLLAVVMFR